MAYTDAVMIEYSVQTIRIMYWMQPKYMDDQLHKIVTPRMNLLHQTKCLSPTINL